MPTYVLVFPVTNWTEFLYRCPVPDQGLVIPRNEGMLCFNRRLREGSEDDTCTGSYQYINIGNKVYSVPCSESSSCWVIPSTPHIRLGVGSQDDLNYPHWRTTSIIHTFTGGWSSGCDISIECAKYPRMMINNFALSSCVYMYDRNIWVHHYVAFYQI